MKYANIEYKEIINETKIYVPTVKLQLLLFGRNYTKTIQLTQKVYVL